MGAPGGWGTHARPEGGCVHVVRMTGAETATDRWAEPDGRLHRRCVTNVTEQALLPPSKSGPVIHRPKIIVMTEAVDFTSNPANPTPRNRF